MENSQPLMDRLIDVALEHGVKGVSITLLYDDGTRGHQNCAADQALFDALTRVTHEACAILSDIPLRDSGTGVVSAVPQKA